MLILYFFAFLSKSVYSEEKIISYDKFEKTVLSKNVNAKCLFDKGDENGMFKITYREVNMTHNFYLMRGIDFDLCYQHLIKVKRLKRQSKYITISAINGRKEESKKNEVTWSWNFIKTDKDCDSHLANYCYLDSHPGKMY